jgi:hypothetical protein
MMITLGIKEAFGTTNDLRCGVCHVPTALLPTARFRTAHSHSMAERDAAARLRRAVKGTFYFPGLSSTMYILITAENNLFLVKRLIQRIDMRNPDTASRRYTSLAWAAVLGHEALFEFLMTAGHDDEELSKVPIVLPYHSLGLQASSLGLRE